MSRMFQDMMTGLNEVGAFLAGRTEGYKVNVPAQVDVKGIRKTLKMTQARFSDTFGFSLDAVKHWEGGRRTPESSARAFLTLIGKNPSAVIAALHPQVQHGGHPTVSGETRTVLRTAAKALRPAFRAERAHKTRTGRARQLRQAV